MYHYRYEFDSLNSEGHRAQSYICEEEILCGVPFLNRYKYFFLIRVRILVSHYLFELDNNSFFDMRPRNTAKT